MQSILLNREAFKQNAIHCLSFQVSDLWFEELCKVILSDKKAVVWESVFDLVRNTRTLFETMMVNEIVYKKKCIYIDLNILKMWSESQRNLEQVVWLYHTSPFAKLPTLECPLDSDEIPTKRNLSTTSKNL